MFEKTKDMQKVSGQDQYFKGWNYNGNSFILEQEPLSSVMGGNSCCEGCELKF